MKHRSLHSWNISPKEAIDIQSALKDRVRFQALKSRIEFIAGADVSFSRRSPDLYGGVVVVRTDNFQIVESYGLRRRATFPYVPGLLSFREVPVLLEAFQQIRHTPDVLICDGQGLAHPRRFGLACHLGVLLNIPTIGCAKSLLVGTYKYLGRARGSSVPLLDQQEQVGWALRTRAHVSPVYVSPGHLVTMKRITDIILQCSPRYRIPEPIRAAHAFVNTLRKAQAD